MSSTHTPGEESPDATTDRGQHIFCKNLLLNLFEPGISPCKTEFPDVKIKRQIIGHYLKDICNLTQQYGIYSIEFSSPNQNGQPWSSGLGTCLSTRESCVRIPLRSRLEGSQCLPPPQGGTGCGEMDDISPSPTVGLH